MNGSQGHEHNLNPDAKPNQPANPSVPPATAQSGSPSNSAFRPHLEGLEDRLALNGDYVFDSTTITQLQQNEFRKFDTQLTMLADEVNQFVANGGNIANFQTTNPLITDKLDIVNGKVVVTAGSAKPQDLLRDLEALGMTQGSVFGTMVSGYLPLVSLDEMAALEELQLARGGYKTSFVGIVTSQGDASLAADIARANFGVDGSGILVGTLSDSYDVTGLGGGAAADVANGDLPPGVIVVQEGNPFDSDEGRAMMQIIADVAPGTAQAFATANGGEANFANNILALAAVGSQIINDDIAYLSEPMYSDGVVAQAVDQVFAQGIPYFAAAGNQDRQSFESLTGFRDSGNTFQGAATHDFDPGAGVDDRQSITATVPITITFQWDDPFFTATNGANSAASNLDIYAVDAAGNIVAQSTANNIGGDPVELLAVPQGTFDIVITLVAGPTPTRIKWVAFDGVVFNDTFDAFASASFWHNHADGGFGVAAAFYQQTPAFGVNPPIPEDFTSLGGTDRLFDVQGNRLPAPVERFQPRATGPDGANTTFFSPGSDVEGDGFDNFFGTSAATPHLAGVAALMLELVPSLTPAQVYQIMQDSAIDMDDPFTPGFDIGYDFLTGTGLVQADRALQLALDSLVTGGGRITPLIIAIDASTSMNEVGYQDVNGDGVVDIQDDLNEDGAFGTVLDLAIREALGRANGQAVGVVVFGQTSSLVDTSNDVGIQLAVAPGADSDGNLISDLEDTIRSVTVGKAGYFAEVMIDPEPTDYSSVTQLIVALAPTIAAQTNYDPTAGVGVLANVIVISDGSGRLSETDSLQLLTTPEFLTVINTVVVGPYGIPGRTREFRSLSTVTGGQNTGPIDASTPPLSLDGGFTPVPVITPLSLPGEYPGRLPVDPQVNAAGASTSVTLLVSPNALGLLGAFVSYEQQQASGAAPGPEPKPTTSHEDLLAELTDTFDSSRLGRDGFTVADEALQSNEMLG